MMTGKSIRALLISSLATLATLLGGCGFHLRGEMPLAEPLHSVYVQSVDPYGVLTRNLEQSLKMSHVALAASPNQAKTIIVISRDETSQALLSVGATQQTRQYKLTAVVDFAVTDASGQQIISPQQLADSRVITVQSNQILGSSNEANLYFQQMQRGLASAIMYRLSSREITDSINKAFKISAKPQTTSTPVNHKKKRST